MLQIFKSAADLPSLNVPLQLCKQRAVYILPSYGKIMIPFKLVRHKECVHRKCMTIANICNTQLTNAKIRIRLTDKVN